MKISRFTITLTKYHTMYILTGRQRDEQNPLERVAQQQQQEEQQEREGEREGRVEVDGGQERGEESQGQMDEDGGETQVGSE